MVEVLNQIDTLLSLSELRRHVPLAPGEIERYVQQGSFPAPVLVGGRREMWRASDIAAYIANLQPLVRL